MQQKGVPHARVENSNDLGLESQGKLFELGRVGCGSFPGGKVTSEVEATTCAKQEGGQARKV